MRTTLYSAALALTFSACARPTPEQQIVNDAAAAMGGRDRILAVKTLVIEGDGKNGNLGQDMTPEATGQAFMLSDYTRAIDLAGHRVRVEQTRTPNFAYFQGMAPQKQVQGLDGDVAYNVAANGTATRAANNVAKDRRAELFHHPLAIVQAALDQSSKLSNARQTGAERVVDVTTAYGGTLTLAIDATTKLPTRVVSMADNLNLGDVAIETGFADYQDAHGLKLPSRLTTKADSYTTAEIHVARQTVDGATGDLAAPAAAASAAPIAGPPPATITVEALGKGVWFLGGQSHHSVLIEFADHLTLIEAPQNDVRALAVIAKARELVPGKPLTHVVNTHHHFDHSGGIRAAVSEGLTVITHKGNEAFYKMAVGRAHTIQPDALAKNQKPLKVEAVDDQLVLEDATRTVHVFAITGNPHSDTFLMAYVPQDKILIEVDAFTPGAAAQPYAANLLENVKVRSLKVDRIVPLHGAIAPFSELVKAAGS